MDLDLLKNNRYRLLDTKRESFFAFTPQEDCLKWNDQGYGIFWTVNSFKTTNRQEINLKSLDYLYGDMDKLPKPTILNLLENGFPPTLIVETKNGYHVYWRLSSSLEPNQKNIERYKSILKNRIIPFYHSDPGAKDASRVFRVPEFYHRKDPTNPFLIKLKNYNPGLRYTLGQFEKCYPYQYTKKENPNSNCEEELLALSGSSEVNGDIFSFKSNSNGTRQIFVNGKSSSCWIDKNGLIGSHSNGGPTVKRWLAWYRKH